MLSILLIHSVTELSHSMVWKTAGLNKSAGGAQGVFALLILTEEVLEPGGYCISNSGRGELSHTSWERDHMAV